SFSCFFFSSRRRHTRSKRDWSSDVCSSDLTAIRRIANEIFDFTETTRRSLGTHWQVRTPQERDEVTRLFADLLERSYIGRIETYSGERIQFLGVTIDGDQTTVRSRLLTKQGMETPVDYRMHR